MNQSSASSCYLEHQNILAFLRLSSICKTPNSDVFRHFNTSCCFFSQMLSVLSRIPLSCDICNHFVFPQNHNPPGQQWWKRVDAKLPPAAKEKRLRCLSWSWWKNFKSSVGLLTWFPGNSEFYSCNVVSL